MKSPNILELCGTDHQIPESLYEEFMYCLPKSERKKWKFFNNSNRISWFQDFLYEANIWNEYDRKLIPKEVAEFLIAFAFDDVPSHGGYPYIESMDLPINGKTYTISAFGWPNENGELTAWSYMFAYEK